MIDGRNFFDKLIKSDVKIYKNIRKLQLADDYTTVCLLDYNYLKKHCKKIVIDLSKQQALDSEPKVTQ